MSDELESLKKTVFKQDKQIQALSDKNHEFDIELTKISGSLKGINSSYCRLEQRLTDIYQRFDSFDNELKDSFKERDKELTNLRVSQAKMLAWATAVFTIVTIVIQIGMRIMI